MQSSEPFRPVSRRQKTSGSRRQPAENEDEMTTVQVFAPTGETSIPPRRVTPPLDSIRGKRVGYHHARGPYLQVAEFADKLGELLTEKYEISEYIKLKSIVDRGASGWSDP